MCPVICELGLKTKCGEDKPKKKGQKKKKKEKKKKKKGEKEEEGGGDDEDDGGEGEEEGVDPLLVFNNYMGLGLTLQE